MDRQIIIFYILSGVFIGGSIYNFGPNRRWVYLARLTRPRIILILLIPLTFLSLSYFVSDGLWGNYMLAGLGSVFAISPIMGEVINEKGIYYLAHKTKFIFIRLIRWEDIKSFEMDVNKGKLLILRLKNRTIFLNQYYHLKDTDAINKYIKERIKKS